MFKFLKPLFLQQKRGTDFGDISSTKDTKK
jgi:hypothetical protein